MTITSRNIDGMTVQDALKIKKVATSEKILSRFKLNTVVKINVDSMTDNIHSKHFSITISDFDKDVSFRVVL